MKRKLLLAALCVVGAIGMRAQTNIIAGWDGGNDTSSPSNFGWTSSANRTLQPRNNNGGIRMTTTYSDYKLENGTSYSYSATSDPSSVIFWLRYNSTGESFTYTFQGLEAEHYYKFSALVGWHNNSNSPTFTVKLNDGTNDLATMSKSVSTKQTLYNVNSDFTAPSTMTSTTDVKVVFTCNQTGDCMEAISALKLVEDFEKYRNELSELITYATPVNSKLNNSALGTAITTAQGKIEDTTNNVTYSDVSALKSAINTAIGSYSLNPAGDDISALYIWNNGFDFDINFGSSSSTNTSSNTVYPTYGWTPIVPGNCTGATIGYGYSGTINGSGNVTAPTQNADGTTDGGALVICVGWSGEVTYKSLAKTFPAGSYRITYRAYNGNTRNTSAIEAIPLVGFVPTTGDAQINAAKESFTNQAWTTHTYDFVLAAETEGQIQIGLKPTSNTNSYNAPELFIDEVKLEYFNPVVLAQMQFEEKIDEAKAITAPHEAAIKTALATAITTAEAVTATTVEEYETAKAALQTAIDNSNTSINHYQNDLKPVIDKLKTYATADLSAMDDDYNNGVYTSQTDKAALIVQYQPIEIAALQAANATDYTSAIINPNFEFDAAAVQNPTGWTMTEHGSDDGTRNVAVTNMSGWYYNAYQTWWSTNIDIKQTITGLPNGQYTIGATLAGWTGCTVDLTANDAKKSINGAGDGTGVAASTTCVVTNGTLNIKVNWGVRESGTFFKCDNFTLTYNGFKPILKDALDKANAIKGSNIGGGAFQIPSSAVETLTTAIGDAQNVYNDDDATGSDVQTAIDNLNAAIETYQAVELNAPASGVQYRIKSTAAEAAGWKNKYYVLKKDAGQAHGGYNTRAEVSTTDAFYATAWEFVSVSGNQYKLRMTDADGDVRYLCTNIKGYDDGSATQIRTTTDADKALVVKVIAATGTDGRWFLQNTEDNSYLGGQDAGLYSNSQNYDLAIEAASQAEVAVSVAAGKYATRIFPFKPTLPEGVVAYSCAAVNNETLTLDEVTTFAANVPYILYSENGVETTNLTGWGTASAVSYEAGLLTGVYTNAVVTAGKYVLQTQDGVQGFYQVAEGDNFEAIPYRAYLTWSGTHANVRALFFPAADEATGIEAIGVLTSGNYDAIYTAGGAKVNSLQKGLNIVVKDGKSYKIFVK